MPDSEGGTERVADVLAQLNAARKQFIIDGPVVHANIEPLEAVQAIVAAIHYIEGIESAMASEREAVLRIAKEMESRDDGAPITHPFLWDCRCWAARLREACGHRPSATPT